MSSTNPDWSRFIKRIFIAKSPAVVYEAWAVPANISRWFLEEAHYIKANKEKRIDSECIEKDDRYTWRWHNWDLEENGRVQEANGKDRISFTFGSGGVVHLKLTPKDGGTMLELIQEQIPEDNESKMNLYLGCSTGWTFWLTNLKAWLEHGITLNATGLSQEETRHLVNS